jgi:hypothetical protein
MAITKTVEIISIRYQKATQVPVVEDDLIWVDKKITLDDPENSDDPHFPIIKHDAYKLYADSDISGEEQIVKDIFAAVFKTKKK